MAKVPFSKLDVKLNNEIKDCIYYNSKGEEVHYEVKHYLPVQEKMEMITRIINQSIDDNGFYNPIRIKIFTVLEVTYAYTNLSFTAKQKEDSFKLYDLLVGTGIFKDVVNCIYEDDWKEIQETIIKTIDNIYKYKNSAFGIMETISQDYSDTKFDLDSIQNIISDPEILKFVKEIIPFNNSL